MLAWGEPTGLVPGGGGWPIRRTDAASYLYLTHLMISRRLGFFPYIRIPTR